MNRLNILHLASYLGGGTARYLEDLTHYNTAHNHFVLSIGTQDDVLFAKAQNRYYPLVLKTDQQWQAEPLQTSWPILYLVTL